MCPETDDFLNRSWPFVVSEVIEEAAFAILQNHVVMYLANFVDVFKCAVAADNARLITTLIFQECVDLYLSLVQVTLMAVIVLHCV
jgi:hypothetical protein